MTEKKEECNSPITTRVAVLEERTGASARLAEERDRFYLEKFKASEVAVAAAITAQKEQTASSFASSEKAIVKAEQAQADYNSRSNEFRGQLDDQAKTLMPRQESQTLFKSFEDKLEDLKKNVETLRESNKKDIADLRESRSGTTGKTEGMHMVVTFLVGMIGPAIAVIAVMMKK